MLIKMMKDNGIDIDTAGILDPEKAADAIFKAINKKKGVLEQLQYEDEFLPQEHSSSIYKIHLFSYRSPKISNKILTTNIGINRAKV